MTDEAATQMVKNWERSLRAYFEALEAFHAKEKARGWMARLVPGTPPQPPEEPPSYVLARARELDIPIPTLSDL